MKIIVTGGNGFIGSHLVESLTEIEGLEIYVIDINISSNIIKPQKSPIYYFCSNILDKESISFENATIFHLAAQSRITPCIENPYMAYKINTLGTVRLLQKAVDSGAKRFIFSSSSSVYGLANVPPLSEAMKTDCLNPYSSSKYAAEEACKFFYSLFGLKTISLRYFNVFGERCPNNSSYCPVTSIFLKQKKDGKKLTVVGDGLQRRDYVYVKDVVKANLLSAFTENNDCFGKVFNVGYGKNYSVIEIAKLIGDDIEFIPQRPGEARDTLADTKKAKEFLNFQAETDIINWIKKCM